MPNGKHRLFVPATGLRSRAARDARGENQCGFTYLGLLLAIAILGALLASAGVVWHTEVQRQREQELLFVGDQIRQAIGRYYSKGTGARQYPQTLADLLLDPRYPSIQRYLRKLYHDPITGSTDWGLVRDADGRILGVYSQSDEQPIKQANFSVADQAFEGKDKYSDWVFLYQPRPPRGRVAGPTTAPAGAPAAPAPEVH